MGVFTLLQKIKSDYIEEVYSQNLHSKKMTEP